MATTVARLSSNGVYFTSNYFDEVNGPGSSNSITSSVIYSSEFDEITLQEIGGGLAKRETIDGKLLISGYFDEVTGIDVIQSLIGPTTSTHSPTLFGSLTLSATNLFGNGENSYILNGTNQYLTIPASTDWVMGTGDFTIEWFQYMMSQPSHPRVFSIGTYPSAAWSVSIEGGTFYHWEVSSPPKFNYSLTAGGYLNQWVHFAICRINNNTKVYKNGIQIGASYTDNNNINNSSTVFTIGQESAINTGSYFHGLITSFRICKGLGVYTGNFTIPTSKLARTQSANPYGGSNTSEITDGKCVLLLNP